jgi:transcriptional regulator with XRE-family HTH domain
MSARDNIRKETNYRFGGKSAKFASEAGISNPYLNEIPNGKRRYNETWLLKIADALGRSLVAFDVEDKSEIQNHKIYAVEILGEEITIKRVFKADQDLILLADNLDFPEFP